jgi:hypothetical protein
MVRTEKIALKKKVEALIQEQRKTNKQIEGPGCWNIFQIQV